MAALFRMVFGSYADAALGGLKTLGFLALAGFALYHLTAYVQAVRVEGELRTEINKLATAFDTFAKESARRDELSAHNLSALRVHFEQRERETTQLTFDIATLREVGSHDTTASACRLPAALGTAFGQLRGFRYSTDGRGGEIRDAGASARAAAADTVPRAPAAAGARP